MIIVSKSDESTDQEKGTCFNGIIQCMARIKLDNTRYQLLRG